MKADGSLKSLLQGVSQQPVRDRLPGQCTEQINMSADPVKGLTRRPGDDLVNKLGPDATVQGWGNFQTQDGRQFLCKITSTGPQIFDYNGTQYTVNLTGGAGYWSTAGKWSFATMKSKTYLANSGVVTEMDTTTPNYYNAPLPASGKSSAAIFQILGGNYGKTYTIKINGTQRASFQTADGSSASHSTLIGTKYIANQLASQLVTNLGAPGSGWGVSLMEDLILVIAPAGSAALTVSITDDAGNVNAKAMSNTVSDIADLPKWAPHGYIVRVAEETDPEEDLWLQFISDSTSTVGGGWGQSGAWYEAAKPGLQIRLKRSSMPRVITWDPTTLQFTCGEVTWADRTVGTETTNPTPSFVGYGINDMGVFQSRLIFLAGPNVIGSKSKNAETFWVGSASTLVDSDPIDLTSQAAFASTLEFAVPHNKDYVVFSPKGQFVLFGRSAVTPSNAALVLTTSFEADLEARPVACGRNVFFATRYGRFAGVREFYTEGGTDINDTRSITSHVNQYLKGATAYMSATSNYNTLLVHTDQDTMKVYPYQFMWSDNEKIQSAWSTWNFPNSIVFSFFDDELIYLVQQVGSGHYLLRLSLDVFPADGLEYHLHTSNRFDVFGVNTQFVLPFDWMADKELIVVQGVDCPNPGLPVRVLSVEYDAGEAGYVVTLKNDMQLGDVVVGISYESRYMPTMPRMKDADGVVISNSRLQINQFLISTEDTGEIVGQKLTKWGDASPVKFEGFIVNSVNSVVGKPALDEYLVKIPFKERADRGEIALYTKSHWPMTILDVEWEGTVNKRGRRLAQGES